VLDQRYCYSISVSNTRSFTCFLYYSYVTKVIYNQKELRMRSSFFAIICRFVWACSFVECWM